MFSFSFQLSEFESIFFPFNEHSDAFPSCDGSNKHETLHHCWPLAFGKFFLTVKNNNCLKKEGCPFLCHRAVQKSNFNGGLQICGWSNQYTVYVHCLYWMQMRRRCELESFSTLSTRACYKRRHGHTFLRLFVKLSSPHICSNSPTKSDV